MKCREAETLMALHVGQDLDDAARIGELNAHLAECSACRLKRRRLKRSMVVLQPTEASGTYEVRDSLWPAVSSRLASPRTRQTSSKAWVSVGSFVVACLLLVAVLQIEPPVPGGAAGNAMVPKGAISGLGALSHQSNSHRPPVEKPRQENQGKPSR